MTLEGKVDLLLLSRDGKEKMIEIEYEVDEEEKQTY